MYRNFGLTLCILFLIHSSCNKNKTQKLPLNDSLESEFLGFPSLGADEFKKIDSPYLDTSISKTLDHFYTYFWEGNDLWGDFLIAQGNRIILERYRGYSNWQDSTKITSHTPIHLASISKNLTAMMVLKLIEKNKLTFQQKVSTILPKFPYQEITIFDLLTHRSGLGNYDHYAEEYHWVEEDSAVFTNQRMYEMFSACEPSLLFKPNTHHSYSNTNYAFLALVIEQITQLKYPKAMKKLLFEPLQMNDTYVFTQAQKNTATRSYYYNKKTWNWDKFDFIYGDKNIYSTARDLFKYSQAMFSPKFMRKSLLDSAMTGYSYEKSGVKNYGLGFRLREFDNGKKIIFHTGKWHGNNTLFMHSPDEKLTIIALGNRLNRANYSAFSLISLFGDYPLELEAEDELLQVTDDRDQEKIDSITQIAQKLRSEKLDAQNSNKTLNSKKNIKDSLNTYHLQDSITKKKKSAIPKKAKDSISRQK